MSLVADAPRGSHVSLRGLPEPRRSMRRGPCDESLSLLGWDAYGCRGKTSMATRPSIAGLSLFFTCI